MNEFLDPAKDSRPFGFALRPDFGGTKYNISREIFPDKIVFRYVDNIYLKTITIPGDKSFLKATVETKGSGQFLEAYYYSVGDLISASIWFRRYCLQNGFEENGYPSDNIKAVNRELAKNKADVMFEMNCVKNSLGLFYCHEAGTADTTKVISEVVIQTNPYNFDEQLKLHLGGTSLAPVTFIAQMEGEGDFLTLGFLSNDEPRLVSDTLSTIVDFSRLGGRSRPDVIKDIFEEIFVKPL